MMVWLKVMIDLNLKKTSSGYAKSKYNTLRQIVFS